jgi:PKD repeat protein
MCIVGKTFLLSTIAINVCILRCFAQQDSGRIILDKPGYPYVFELNTGENHTLRKKSNGQVITRTVKIISIKPYFETNYWFKTDSPEIYSKAEVVLEVSGKRFSLSHRPYQMPVEFDGMRWYVETIREWAQNAAFMDMKDVGKDVRISAVPAGESWGPASMIFPIKDYRWKAAVYHNTWSALVPYNLRYYHRGEDYGAIPDKLDIVAPFDGSVIASAFPAGDGRSNSVVIKNADDIVFRVSHMNIETIRDVAGVGKFIEKGTPFAKTGMTWDGRKSQEMDPHCHTELRYNNTFLASYPYLVEAYLRTYPDPLIAVAGGYHYTIVGHPVELDGTRSITNKNQRIKSYSWKLHNGIQVTSPKTTFTYEKSGLYTEQLTVKTESGEEDSDLVQVRVYDTTKTKDIAYGWAYHHPVRNIHPGTSVLFWNRLTNTKSPVLINFGDGSSEAIIDKEISHVFRSKGRYVVALSSTGSNFEPLNIKMEVVVE